MKIDDLKVIIAESFSSATFEENGEWLSVIIDSDVWQPFAKQIFENPKLQFDYLFCLTCVDWKTHLTMVYHITSTTFRHSMVVKAKLDRNNPEIESVAHLWRTAEFHEREVFDLFGVNFIHHPDLRRLFLTDDWAGFPLRKDFEDPINLIKL
ncbi:MAG: NADH-quinone oxidoreductase subunit C [Chitinophagales bacterium]|nr:NADH-quinone oxidoreductase subunit C [Chitinophagales bacterium]